MLNTALKLIKTIEEHGYIAYIVGGFVRDQLLGITSNDIDICTSARPSDIRNIFPTSCHTLFCYKMLQNSCSS